MPARVLIIEDDRAMAEGLAHLLGLQGYEAIVSEGFGDVATQASDLAVDCALVDLKLPGADGHEICRDLRAGSSSLAIIVLTSSDAEFDEVMSLRLGADDHITKPYRPAVLLERLRSALERRQGARPATTLTRAGVTLDLAAGTVAYEGRSAETTRNELRVLRVLMQADGAVVTRQELMRALWESDEFVDDNTLTVNVNRVRQLLARLGVPEGFLQTRRGVGYVVR